MEWLDVGFTIPVHATAIEVHETVNPGAVTRVLVRDLDFELHDVWSGDEPGSGCPAILRIDFDRLPFPTNRVRIELNPSLVSGLNLMKGVRQAGKYSVRWDGRNEGGHSLASGVYFSRLHSGDCAETRKLLLLR
jgi:hypothetical protein